MLGGLDYLEISPLQQVFNQISLLFAGDYLRVQEEELQVDRVVRVLVQEEVSVGFKQF